MILDRHYIEFVVIDAKMQSTIGFLTKRIKELKGDLD